MAVAALEAGLFLSGHVRHQRCQVLAGSLPGCVLPHNQVHLTFTHPPHEAKGCPMAEYAMTYHVHDHS